MRTIGIWGPSPERGTSSGGRVRIGLEARAQVERGVVPEVRQPEEVAAAVGRDGGGWVRAEQAVAGTAEGDGTHRSRASVGSQAGVELGDLAAPVGEGEMGRAGVGHRLDP